MQVSNSSTTRENNHPARSWAAKQVEIVDVEVIDVVVYVDLGTTTPQNHFNSSSAAVAAIYRTYSKDVVVEKPV